MTITKKENGKSFTLSVEGRLDTLTSPELEKEINELSASAEDLVVDFAKLEYISSAGLRVLLSAHKLFAKKGGMTITNVNETVLDIFEVTGFKDILTIR
ncbi:STAS domain-containing protein [uncultured Treponema sp.]|uniref:STAS domain-containing protein n=1 Tax=uncultured Treponema sp. TaxID=162155 RepID=UPI0025EF1746|nr:STAS domain-containing protein [uncultured Treponema sp.]